MHSCRLKSEEPIARTCASHSVPTQTANAQDFMESQHHRMTHAPALSHMARTRNLQCPMMLSSTASRRTPPLFLMQMKTTTFGTDCENMCKSLGAYPNCQCPGFNGEPASSDDTRACFVTYGQDPKSPMPNDAFVNCVKENTAAFLMQMKTTTFGTDCENMCKSLGAYPNCQCPGFNGEPASSDDTRACFVKYGQDPASPMPNDAFV